MLRSIKVQAQRKSEWDPPALACLLGVDLPGLTSQRRDSAGHWGTPGICRLGEHRDDSAVGPVTVWSRDQVKD